MSNSIFFYPFYDVGVKRYFAPYDTRIASHFSTKNGYFSVFCGSISHTFSCKHETHDLLTLASFYQFLLKICVFDEPLVGMAVWLIACRNKKSTSWIHIPT